MKLTDYNLQPAENRILTDRILHSYQRDHLYFEHYSPRFDHEFLSNFEKNVEILNHLTPRYALESELKQKNEKIEIAVNHFRPLLNFTEALLQRVADEINLPVSKFCINEFRNALNKGCTFEIQIIGKQLVGELESHIEDLIDKGFIIRILTNFHYLIEKLKSVEEERSNFIQQMSQTNEEYKVIEEQLEDCMNAIIKSSHAVFGENNIEKRNEYTLEKMMLQIQFSNAESH